MSLSKNAVEEQVKLMSDDYKVLEEESCRKMCAESWRRKQCFAFVIWEKVWVGGMVDGLEGKVLFIYSNGDYGKLWDAFGCEGRKRQYSGGFWKYEAVGWCQLDENTALYFAESTWKFHILLRLYPLLVTVITDPPTQIILAKLRNHKCNITLKCRLLYPNTINDKFIPVDMITFCIIYFFLLTNHFCQVKKSQM